MNTLRENIRNSINLLYAGLWIVFLFFPCTVSPSEVFVGGTLQSNATWTTGNTYVVVETVIIPSQIRLDIEAGATVKFNQFSGMFVDGGQLHISGAPNDSVYFIPNHQANDSWFWNGITLSSIGEPDQVHIEYAGIRHAQHGIRGSSSDYVLIRHSNISNHLTAGLLLENSSDWHITDNKIANNLRGIEISASGNGNSASGNHIMRNNLSNADINIFLQSIDHATADNNLFEHNLLQSAGNGIWLFSTSHGVSGGTSISHNFIINNGTGNGGHGLILSVKGVTVNNNIFWNNSSAVDFTNAQQVTFFNNNIYHNNKGITIRNNSDDIHLYHNTLTANKNDFLSFQSAGDIDFSNNNVFDYKEGAEGIIKNLTAEDIHITDNFWGTTNDSIINRLMYHAPNDPDLGELIYEPFLEQPDPDAPVSAPSHVVRQDINNQTRIAWRSNPEADVIGYRLYYGSFADYQFDQSVEDLITDTVYVFVLPEGARVAVTAVINEDQGASDQLAGLESPFAFAVHYPFAGEDKFICSTQPLLNIQESNVPAGIDSLLWQTSGDGAFSNPRIVRPVYFPGHHDRASGEVVLRLTAFSNGQALADSMLLGIDPVPEIFAGPNTIISPGDQYMTDPATALHAGQVLWTSGGDGFFTEPDSLHTTYIPGPDDIALGSVNLTLTGFADHCNDVSHTMTLKIQETHSVSGRLWASNVRVPNKPVIAVRFSGPGGFPTRSITYTDQTGHFEFDALFKGTYVFFAPSDTLQYAEFVPSYHVWHSRWQDAYLHTINGDTYELDIRLNQLPVSLPKGEGSISGIFEMSDLHPADIQILCNPWFSDANRPFCSEGLSNVSILLFGESRRLLYRHTLTDATGKFSFTDLPYGNYILEAEFAGYESNSSPLISLMPGQETISGVQLIIADNYKIEIHLPDKHQFESQISHAFPNPNHGQFHVNGLNMEDVVTIYNHHGQLIKSKTAGQQNLYFDLPAKGLHFIVIRRENTLPIVEKMLIY